MKDVVIKLAEAVIRDTKFVAAAKRRIAVAERRMETNALKLNQSVNAVQSSPVSVSASPEPKRRKRRRRRKRKKTSSIATGKYGKK
jgi:hypothetical protein